MQTKFTISGFNDEKYELTPHLRLIEVTDFMGERMHNEIRLDGRPNRHHGCIAQQTHHDGCLFASFFDAKECFARYPTVGDCLFVCLTLTLTDNDIESVVTKVQ